MVKIYMEVISKNMPFKFEGNGELKKDLILFNDGEHSYIFDKKTNKLIKEKKDEKMTIDFVKEQIIINSDDIELDFNISLLFEKIDDNYFNFQYKLDKETIELILKVEEE